MQRIGVQDLENSGIDWSNFQPDWIYGTGYGIGGKGDCLRQAKHRFGGVADDRGDYQSDPGYQVLPSGLQRKPQKVLRPHQQEALEKVIAGLQTHDRGKLRR